MTPREADRRFRRTFLPAMLFYSIFCFAGPMLLQKMSAPPIWAVSIVAVVTGIPIVVVFWLMGRHLRETDEYTRKIQIDAMLAGGAITLSVAVLWGFLELFDVIPRFFGAPSMLLVAPVFFVAWGLATSYQALRRR